MMTLSLVSGCYRHIAATRRCQGGQSLDSLTWQRYDSAPKGRMDATDRVGDSNTEWSSSCSSIGTQVGFVEQRYRCPSHRLARASVFRNVPHSKRISSLGDGWLPDISQCLAVRADKPMRMDDFRRRHRRHRQSMRIWRWANKKALRTTQNAS